MRLLKVFLTLLVILVVAYFLSNNSDQSPVLWYFPGKAHEINLAYILVGTLGAGIVLGFIIGLIQILTQQRLIRLQNRQLKKLRTELNNLRHSALEEDIFEGQGEVEPAPATVSATTEESPPEQES